MAAIKNILIVSQSEIGATETFIQAHLDNLQGNIFHIHGYNLDYFENGISLKEKYKIKSCIFSRLVNFLPHFFVFRIKQKRERKYDNIYIIKKYLIENEIDVVLGEYGISGAYITSVCKFLKIPLLVHFHGYDASRYDVIKKFSSSYVEMFSYAKSIFVVSNRMFNDLKILHCPSEKMVLNPYGPDPTYFNVSPDYTSKNIIAIGRQTNKKAPYLSILSFYKALKLSPDLHLHFIGDGELLEVSKNLVIGLGIEDKVHFHGVKPREYIIDLFTNSFLFIQHSIVAWNGDSEGTPVAILEAMAGGLPIVATKHAGIQDVVLEGETGFLVDELDVYMMANKIFEISNDRQLAELMGNKGKERVRSLYTIKKHIDRIQEKISSSGV